MSADTPEERPYVVMSGFFPDYNRTSFHSVEEALNSLGKNSMGAMIARAVPANQDTDGKVLGFVPWDTRVGEYRIGFGRTVDELAKDNVWEGAKDIEIRKLVLVTGLGAEK